MNQEIKSFLAFATQRKVYEWTNKDGCIYLYNRIFIYYNGGVYRYDTGEMLWFDENNNKIMVPRPAIVNYIDDEFDEDLGNKLAEMFGENRPRDITEVIPDFNLNEYRVTLIGFSFGKLHEGQLKTISNGQSDITRHESLVNQPIAPMYDQGYIKWEDPEVKRIILQYYNNANGTNKTELTKDEVLEITYFKGILSSNTNITSLNDLQYFTNWSRTYQGTSGPEHDKFINIWGVKSIIFPEFDESVAFTECYINGLRDLEYIEFPESVDLWETPFVNWYNDTPTHHVTIKLKNPNPSDIFNSGTWNGEPYIFQGLNDASDFTILVPRGSKQKYMDKFVDVNNNGYSESHYEEY